MRIEGIARITVMAGWCCVLAISPLGAQNATMFVQNSKVGINVAVPEQTLHIASSDGTSQILVDDTASASAIRELLFLRNNGRAGFAFEDITSGAIWKFTSRGGGFEIRRKFAAAPSIKVEGSGNIKMGPSTAIVFELDPNGDLELSGTLTQGSSRSIKTDLEKLDGDEILSGVAALPLYEWAYTSDPQSSRHVGPVAEDFYSTFGLGADDRHLAPSDTAGVALAATQSLYQLVIEKEAQLSDLRAENADISSRLARLEAKIADLDSGSH